MPGGQPLTSNVRKIPMVDIQIWALAGFLGISAFTTAIKAVEYRRELKLSDEEVSRLRKELDALKQKHEKCVSDFQSFKSKAIDSAPKQSIMD
jgi:type III secretory pathway component EscU